MKLKEGYKVHFDGENIIEEQIINDFEERFHKAINDDLNMPIAMSVVWDIVKYPIKSKMFAKLLKKFDTVLGLKIDEDISSDSIPEKILNLAEERKKARGNKDWQRSDEIREIINNNGYEIKDTKEGYELSKK